MTSPSFEWKGDRALRRNLRGASTVIRGSLNKALRESGRVVLPALKARTPRRTGKLANSTRFQVTGMGHDQALQVRQGARSESGDFYGGYVRQGTRPHRIVPFRAKALRFFMGGEVVFATSVNHPGTKPNRYHVRTLEAVRGKIAQITKKAGVHVAARVADLRGQP